MFCAADARSAQRESAGVQNVERDNVPAADFVQQIFLRHFAIFHEDRRGGAAVNSHLVLFVARRESGKRALDDERGKFFAVNFREHDVDVRKTAVGDPHFLAVENPVFSVGQKVSARVSEACASEPACGSERQ